MNIQELPKEIMGMIFDYLEPKDLDIVSRVCSMWRSISFDARGWENRLNYLYPYIKISKLPFYQTGKAFRLLLLEKNKNEKKYTYSVKEEKTNNKGRKRSQEEMSEKTPLSNYENSLSIRQELFHITGSDNGEILVHDLLNKSERVISLFN